VRLWGGGAECGFERCVLPEDTLLYVIRARPRQKAAGLLMVPAAGHVDSPDHEWPARAKQGGTTTGRAGGAGGLKWLQYGLAAFTNVEGRGRPALPRF
jgi:hypothetical protein